MNKDELKGKVENLKGRGKQAYGAVTGDKGKEAEGLVDRVSGAVREKIGKTEREVSRDVSRDEEEQKDE